MNVEMDSQAKVFREQKHPRPPPRVFCSPWTLCIGSEIICKDYQQELYDHCALVDLRERWGTTTRPTPRHHFDLVDWHVLGQAMLSLPPKRRHWVAKHSVGICSVNTELLRWNRWLDNHCPRCGAAEDARHVWTCPHPEAVTRWEEQIRQLRDWLT